MNQFQLRQRIMLKALEPQILKSVPLGKYHQHFHQHSSLGYFFITGETRQPLPSGRVMHTTPVMSQRLLGES